ncbi:MAG: ABC transporter permease subunit, partial [Sneathiella sp.]|nr:ABC transporter permease subunit [Sneathiella sp.]
MTVDVAGQRGAGDSMWRDPKVRAVLFQVLVIALFLAFVLYIGSNTAANLEKRGIATGFGFLSQPAGFGIGVVLFLDYNAQTSTHGDVLLLGMINTMVVAGVGIVLATLLGFTFGVLRLSHNWIISKIAYVYIETVRNIPLLVQLLFWYFSVLTVLPLVKQSANFGDTLFINRRGVYFPSVVPETGFWVVPVAFILGIIGCFLVARWAHKRQDTTGQQFPVFFVSLGLLFGLPLLATFAMGVPMSLEFAALKGFNFQGG